MPSGGDLLPHNREEKQIDDDDRRGYRVCSCCLASVVCVRIAHMLIHPVALSQPSSLLFAPLHLLHSTSLCSALLHFLPAPAGLSPW
jgi:hypothetical protein